LQGTYIRHRDIGTGGDIFAEDKSTLSNLPLNYFLKDE
jgi:hypothetical protein